MIEQRHKDNMAARLKFILDKHIHPSKSTYEHHFIDQMMFAGDFWFFTSLDMEYLEDFVLENFEYFVKKTSGIAMCQGVKKFRKKFE